MLDTHRSQEPGHPPKNLTQHLASGDSTVSSPTNRDLGDGGLMWAGVPGQPQYVLCNKGTGVQSSGC